MLVIAGAVGARAAEAPPLRRAAMVVSAVGAIDYPLAGRLARHPAFSWLVAYVRATARGLGRPRRGSRGPSRWGAAAELVLALEGRVCTPDALRREWQRSRAQRAELARITRDTEVPFFDR